MVYAIRELHFLPRYGSSENIGCKVIVSFSKLIVYSSLSINRSIYYSTE